MIAAVTYNLELLLLHGIESAAQTSDTAWLMQQIYFAKKNYSGKKLITLGAIAFVACWLAANLGFADQPEWFTYLILSGQLSALAIYLVGYWQAVVSKGYPKILWLAGFTGIIGLIIIMFLPSRSKLTTTP